MGNIKIIGISGVTNGGKTSLSQKIVDHFPKSIVIRQDDFFREEDDPNHIWITLKSGRKHQNWEALESVNWDKLTSQVNVSLNKLGAITSERAFLIIEGHLIFNYKEFPFSFDYKFFFTLPEDECYRRRIERSYLPPDPEGFFHECVYPMYLKNKKQLVQNIEEIVFLDGTENPQHNYKRVLKVITRN